MPKALDERKKRFCREYVKTGNLYQSAIKAGYSKKYAKGRGSYLLEIVGVQDYINSLTKKAENEDVADIKEVKQYWTTVMRSKEEDTRERLKASEYLAKSSGGFIDNVNVAANVKTENPYEGLTTEELKKLIEDDG